MGGKLIVAGSVEDHIHLLIEIPSTLTISHMIMMVKKESTKMIKRETGMKHFRWQNGYFAVSVDYKRYLGLVRYIQNQRKHHQKITFDDELGALTS